jgi:hypothetical protein
VIGMLPAIVIPEAAQRLSGISFSRIEKDSGFTRFARAPE